MTRPHDPGANPEDEGIPDLQEASGPERMPVPGDEPTVADERATTVDEAIGHRSLDDRLADERPDVPERAEEPRAGLLYDAPDSDGARNQDVFAQEGGVDGLSAEEDAVRITDEDELDVFVLDDEDADALVFDQEPVDELDLGDAD
ncbi:DUF5709 domain-containing protein [Streptomyces sp. NPDC052225]|uniref:DUF5709 domain-containing protein n=1 Tax=Streptomyces sp. NPDC052225 TaxID=3154949 RepID=UPI00341EA393